MPVRTTLATSLVVTAILCGCAVQRAEKARNAKLAMIGMSKEDVLACAGPPAQKDAEGATEVWSYQSGNGATSTFATASAYGQGQAFGSPGYAFSNGQAHAFGSSFSQRRFCVVNIVVRNGVVSAVNYNGPTGGLLTRGEQCAYAIENCVPH